MKKLCLLSTVAVAMVGLSSVGQAADMPAVKGTAASAAAAV